MYYISTRDHKRKVTFEQAFLSGLSPDGGLYVPETYPTFSASEISSFKNLTYQELAFKIIKPFIGKTIPDKTLEEVIKKSYNNKVFTHEATAPLKQINNQIWLLELFHGPTLAFKDFALQFVGHILEYFLTTRKEKAIILGATSGDTGSAAIYGCKNSKKTDIFILHPHNLTSEIQRKQMTSVKQKNVHNIAIKGNFDDCQAIVKHIFCNQEFIQKKKRLIAVNSINWARIIGQVVYYFYAAVNLGAPQQKISFSVPTGNFGDIFAGYTAKNMGLPIEKLIIATNKNDILTRFINDNTYNRKKLVPSLSPSMDIQISSNFERLLFNEYNNDSESIVKLMEIFQTSGKLSIDTTIHKKITASFLSSSSNDKEICKTIKQINKLCDMTIDPHTATGIKSAQEFANNVNNTPIVVLSTAHPAKFPIALKKSNIKLDHLPQKLEKLLNSKEFFSVTHNSIQNVVNLITERSL